MYHYRFEHPNSRILLTTGCFTGIYFEILIKPFRMFPFFPKCNHRYNIDYHIIGKYIKLKANIWLHNHRIACVTKLTFPKSLLIEYISWNGFGEKWRKITNVRRRNWKPISPQPDMFIRGVIDPCQGEGVLANL